MDSFYRPTWAEISLGAVKHNIEEFRRVLPDGMRLMAVVKANAYGHGAIQVAEEAVRSGADYLAVAFLDEALQLRDAGITAPILALGYTSPDAVATAVERDITITLYSEDVLRVIEAEGKKWENPLKAHIKLDTGMGRIGVVGEEEAVSFIDRALSIEGLQVEGLFTHYACADETDKSYTLAQHERFDAVVRHFREKGVEFPCLHAGNSATGIDTPDLSYNMLRLGISLYGLYPSDEVHKERVNLQPVMAYKTRVIHVKQLPSGCGVSYGATYRTQGEEIIATIPVGYADGFSRLLSGKAEVLVRGVRVPVVGRICMDQCMINVTNVPGVAVGDEVVLFGSQAGNSISADELAAKLGTINYEITCMLNYRVPRIFIGADGELASIVNLLHN